MPLCWQHHSLLSHKDPNRFHPTTGWQKNTRVLGKEVANVLYWVKGHPLSVTKTRNSIPTSYTLHNQTLESHQCKVSRRRVDREPALEETGPVNCCKNQQSEHLCIREPEGMPTYHPDTLLQRPCASNARVCICGVGPPSATSEVHIRDDATTISQLHPSWLQPNLQCLCRGGPAPTRKSALQENVRQGLHDVHNNERSCRHKPHCRSGWALKLQLQGNTNTNAIKSPTPQQTCTCNPTLELCPHRCSISCDSTCFQNSADRLDGRTYLITISITQWFLNQFLTLSLNEHFNQLLIYSNTLLIHSACNLTVESVLWNQGFYIIMKKMKECK